MSTRVVVRLDLAGYDGNPEGGDNDDVRPGVEGVQGSSAPDTLAGGPGDDTLRGGHGNDNLSGRLGADVLDGGLGTDSVSYVDRTARVVVDLGDPEAGAGDAVDEGADRLEARTLEERRSGADRRWTRWSRTCCRTTPSDAAGCEPAFVIRR